MELQLGRSKVQGHGGGGKVKRGDTEGKGVSITGLCECVVVNSFEDLPSLSEAIFLLLFFLFVISFPPLFSFFFFTFSSYLLFFFSCFHLFPFILPLFSFLPSPLLLSFNVSFSFSPSFSLLS